MECPNRPYNQPNTKCTDEQISEALKRNYGLQWIAARELGISGATMSERIERSEYLQQIKKECFEHRLDEVEKALQSRINEERCMPGIKFSLERLAKHRGYTETQQVGVDPNTLKSFTSLMHQVTDKQKLELENESMAGIHGDLNMDDNNSISE